MALLTKEAEEKIISLLVGEGLADVNLVNTIKSETDASGASILKELINRQIIRAGQPKSHQ